MSPSDFLSESDSDYKEEPSDYISDSLSGPKDMENSISDPNNIENSVSNSINHIPPGIDTVPTKDSEITAQRIDETNEHLYKISEKLDIIVDLLREIKDYTSSSSNR